MNVTSDTEIVPDLFQVRLDNKKPVGFVAARIWGGDWAAYTSTPSIYIGTYRNKDAAAVALAEFYLSNAADVR